MPYYDKLQKRIHSSAHQYQLSEGVSALQNRTLVGVACHVIADMAYVIPDVVLPLAYKRFQVASPAT